MKSGPGTGEVCAEAELGKQYKQSIGGIPLHGC